MPTALETQALAYLESHHVMTLATTGGEGPWATAVFYVSNGFTLFFLTESHTRHARNLAVHPRVAAAVQEDYPDWREVKGLQLAGEASLLSPREKAGILPPFIAKFPSVAAFAADPRYALTWTRCLVYRIAPHELWYLDNRKGFSRRERIIPRSVRS